jgi:hypothetical protein
MINNTTVLKKTTYSSLHFSEIMMIAVFLCVSALIMWRSYFAGFCLSPDASNYLRTAESILSGNGFHAYAEAGWKDYYFSHWPIGYPLLIACVSYVTGTEVYLASKILSILILGAIFVLLYLRFKRQAWVYALIMIGFPCVITDFHFPWSEQPFLLGSLWLIFEIYDVIIQDKPKKYHYFNILIASLLMFFVRYVGLQAVGIIGCAIIYFMAVQKIQKKSMTHKIVPLIIVATIVALTVFIYLYLNYVNTGHAGGSYAHERGEIHSFGYAITSFVQIVKGQILLMKYFLVFAIMVCSVLYFLMKTKYDTIQYNTIQQPLYIIFFAAAVFCDLAFFGFRITTEVDTDFTRHLLVPTIFFGFGFISMIYESSNRLIIQKYKNIAICIVIAYFCIYQIGSAFYHYRSGNKVSYIEMRNNLLEELSDVPSKSIVITTDSKGYKEYSLINFMRPDLLVMQLLIWNDIVRFSYLLSESENIYLYLDTEYIPEEASRDNMLSSPLLKDYVDKREKRLIKVK